MEPWSRVRRQYLLVGVLTAAGLWPATLCAGTFTAFGPQIYTRGTGAPEPVSATFPLNPATTYHLLIQNGGLADDDMEKVSSSAVTFNNQLLVGPQEFSQQVSTIEKLVTPQAQNNLSVELRGKPGGGVIIMVTGVDDDPPQIHATVAPPANTSGWHAASATVSFACADALSGIATCPAPVTVTTEGAAQAVAGTATDRAGNDATTSVNVNLDVTSPALQISTPIHDAVVTSPQLLVTGTVADDLSGIAAVTVNGQAATVIAGAFSKVVSLPSGPSIVEVAVTDVAGNISSASRQVTYNPLTVQLLRLRDGIQTNNPELLVFFLATSTNITAAEVNGIPAALWLTDPINNNSYWFVPLSLDDGLQTITATAFMASGFSASDSIQVLFDTHPPVVSIDTPVPDAVTGATTTIVSGSVMDALSGVASITVGSIQVELSGAQFSIEVPLTAEGPNPVEVVAVDRLGNVATLPLTIFRDTLPPVPSLTAGGPFNTESITLTGEAHDQYSGVESLTLNGIPVTLSGDTFEVSGLTLTQEGDNPITIMTVDTLGNSGNFSFSVLRDTVPPIVTINQPRGNQTFLSPAADVSGTAGDDTSGVASVVVNGIEAATAGETFAVAGVALAAPGINDVTAVAKDLAGNVATATVTVNYDANGIVLSTDSPLPDSIINRDTITVSGQVEALSDTGVSVNGLPAFVESTTGEMQWVAPNIPVAPGQNNLVVKALNSGGGSAETTLSIIVEEPVDQPVHLALNRTTGLVPLTITASISSEVAVGPGAPQFDIDGPALATVTQSDTNDFTVAFTAPGLYTLSVTLVDALGAEHRVEAAVLAMTLAEIDALLQSKWLGLRDALKIGDIDRAVSYFSAGSRERYRQQFDALATVIGNVGDQLEEIEFIEMHDGAAEYELLSTYQGQPVSFFVLFIRDLDGLWRIEAF